MSPFLFTMRCGGFSSLWRIAMPARNAATAPPHWKSRLKCSLWTAARRWRMKAIERERNRADVRDVDGPVRERRALERHVDARRDARERERDDRDAGRLRLPVADVREHPRAVREREDEERDRDEHPEDEVHEEHPHEERRDLRERHEVDRVRGHEPERDEEERRRASSARDEERLLPGSRLRSSCS